MSGYDVPVSGYDVPVPVGGYDVPVGGYDVPVGGYDVTVGGYDVPVGGYDVPVGGYDVSLHGDQEEVWLRLGVLQDGAHQHLTTTSLKINAMYSIWPAGQHCILEQQLKRGVVVAASYRMFNPFRASDLEPDPDGTEQRRPDTG